MTKSSRHHHRVCAIALIAGVAVLLLPRSAHAQSQSQDSKTRSAAQAIVVSSSTQRYEQAVRRQQAQDQLQKSRMTEQLRQQTSDNIKRPYAKDAAVARQIDEADRAHHVTYQARQQDLLDRYHDAVTPQPRLREPLSPPAPLSSPPSVGG